MEEWVNKYIVTRKRVFILIRRILMCILFYITVNFYLPVFLCSHSCTFLILTLSLLRLIFLYTGKTTTFHLNRNSKNRWLNFLFFLSFVRSICQIFNYHKYHPVIKLFHICFSFTLISLTL